MAAVLKVTVVVFSIKTKHFFREVVDVQIKHTET